MEGTLLLALCIVVGEAHAQDASKPSVTPSESAEQLLQTRQRLVDDGRYEEAVSVDERLLALQERRLGPEHPYTLQQARWLAWSYARTGRYEKAESLFLRVRAAMERARQTEHVDYKNTLAGLLRLYRQREDLERTEAITQELLALAEKNGGPDGRFVPEALVRLASVYLDMRDPDHAEPLLVRARSIVELHKEPALITHTYDPDARPVQEGNDEQTRFAYRDELVVLKELARMHRLRGQSNECSALLERALALALRTNGEESQEAANYLDQMAQDHLRRGELGAAEALARRSLGIRERLYGREHAELAATLHLLTQILRAAGKHESAEEPARRAVSLVERAYGLQSKRLAYVIYDLAHAELGQGNVQEALGHFERAAVMEERDMTVALAGGSEGQKRGRMATFRDNTDALLSMHTQHAPADAGAMRLALTTVLRRKGRVVDLVADAFAALRRGSSPDERALLDQFSANAARLSNLTSDRALEMPEHELIHQLYEERKRLEGEISRLSAAFRAEQGLVRVEDVAAALPLGSALVEIVVYRPDRMKGLPTERWGAPRYAAYLLGRGGEMAFADLGEASVMDAAVQAFRRALADPDLTHDPKPAARALDALLMEPLRPHLRGMEQVFLSPDGPLDLIPFGALVDEQGHFQVHRHVFTYLTSGRDLLRLSSSPKPQRRALVIGDPAFGESNAASSKGSTARAGDLGWIGFTPLAGSELEARAVQHSLKDAEVLLREQATERAMKQAHGPRVLHVATHGFFLPSASGQVWTTSESPLLRAGIALAGANQRESGGDDGILTAFEAQALDLRGTRLVVLSACETGLGESAPWEGVYGLRRALVIAGAETQVMSLWKVDTGATRDLMQRYYAALATGAGRSDGMRRAQLGMISEGKAHPNLWAPFIVSGGWKTLDGDEPGPEIQRVTPGARGCACMQAGGEREPPTALALAWLSLALGWARRRSARHGCWHWLKRIATS